MRKLKFLSFLTLLFVVTALVQAALPAVAHADSGWTQDEGRAPRREASGFWNRGPSAFGQRPTAAQISQALYGNSNEPYDTATDPSIPEAYQPE